jgi:hypothetical protein
MPLGDHWVPHGPHLVTLTQERIRVRDVTAHVIHSGRGRRPRTRRGPGPRRLHRRARSSSLLRYLRLRSSQSRSRRSARSHPRSSCRQGRLLRSARARLLRCSRCSNRRAWRMLWRSRCSPCRLWRNARRCPMLRFRRPPWPRPKASSPRERLLHACARLLRRSVRHARRRRPARGGRAPGRWRQRAAEGNAQAGGYGEGQTQG